MSEIEFNQRLSTLKTSEEGVITRVYGRGSFRNRIAEMGFVRGKNVKVIKNAPMQDPVEYEIMGYRIALRRSEAEMIEVTGSNENRQENSPSYATLEHENKNRFLDKAGSTIRVALVGNPNSGKTSLFNVSSGSHERVGNYSGVTIDAKATSFSHNNYTIQLIDLPGTYSLTEYTPEELYVRTYILHEMPDVVINVVDASNLERNLYLTTQLIDMDLSVVMALNMYDELESSGSKLDYSLLGRMIGIPIVPTVASERRGIPQLFDTIIDVFENRQPEIRHIHINYGNDLEESINKLQNLIWENKELATHYSSRYLSLKLLEDDDATLSYIRPCSNYEQIVAVADQERERLEKRLGSSPGELITDSKYGFIAGALEETLTNQTKDKNKKATRIDRLLTHRIWGIPIFMFFMWVMFQTTFSLGEIPAEWMAAGMDALGVWVTNMMPVGPLQELIVNGMIAGVGGVIVFLPNILILFFFISLMEDTGYMARAAFIMDKAMHTMGLHGKSFIPLLMGFGCSVPAIMATRTLRSKKDRLLTMIIIPFMSCSARLPVYVLLISAFFAKQKGLILFSIYLMGIVVAVLSSLIFKRIFFKKEEAPFVMELPPYRVPTTRSVIRHMWDKGAQYLRKMGSIILLASILIWALGHYPNHDETLSPSEQQEQSYIGQMAKGIEPVIRPLGFDWRMGASIVSGLAAKEVIVSTVAVLADADQGGSLAEKLQNQVYTSGERMGEKVYTPLVAYSFMVFVLLYFPCVAAITAIRKEAGWPWALFTLFYTTGVAWLISFAVFQIGSLF